VTRGWPQVTPERLEHNRGFAEACNRGVAAGSQEIRVLINNAFDCGPDFPQALVALLPANLQLRSVAALTVQPGERLMDTIGLSANFTLRTEVVIVLGDLAISRGLAALSGRIAGCRAGAGLPWLARPLPDPVDATTCVRGSFALRRGVYGRRAD
jgi:hypothetical protein